MTHWAADGPPVIDDLEAEYWARQIRIGAAIGAGVTLLGAVHVAVDWPPALRWWALPTAAFALLQAVVLVLPWVRFVRRRAIRVGLIVGWITHLPVLYLFASVDPHGRMLYVPGATLALVTVSALHSPRVVAGLGVAAVGGYLLLLPRLTATNLSYVGMVVVLMVSIVIVNAVNAQSRRRLDERRRSTEHRTELLLEASSDAVIAIGVGGDMRYVSPSAEALLGGCASAITPAGIGGLVHPDDLDRAVAWWQALQAAPAGHKGRTEARVRQPDGSWAFLDVIGTNRAEDPDLTAFVISLRDIGTRRALEERLSRQAFTDPLTGLPNRALFRDRLEHAVARLRGGAVTVLLIDLDDFKLVNDNLGHSAGDELLTEIANRLRAQVRPADTLARLGGDEFAILVEDLDPAAAVVLAERLLHEVRRPTRLASRDIDTTLSIGIATSAGLADLSAEQLLRNADLAMYAAKRSGRNAYTVFEPAMYHSVLEEAQQRVDMERAIEQEQFVVLYQPVVDMHTSRLTAVEALVRWEHPRDGLLSPYTFIANAEANGLIVPLGRWVLRHACAQLAGWQRATPAAAGLVMNVNLSARQFQDAGLVADVAAAISDAGIAPGSLTLEITESMLVHDIDGAIETLYALRGLGVHLAIDDFGTGYSSLSYLKRLPVDIIKIDRSFVEQVDTDAGDTALVDAVVGLGQALRMRTVAEGIETDGQWARLREIGCDHGQGFLFGRPSNAEVVGQLLSETVEVG